MILILGPKKGGKTALINNLQNKNDSKTIPTIGINILTLNFPHSSKTITELGGALLSQWKNYVKNSSAIIYVIDSADVFKFSTALLHFLDIIKYVKLPLLLILSKSYLREDSKELEYLLRLKELRLLKPDLEVIKYNFKDANILNLITKWIENIS